MDINDLKFPEGDEQEWEQGAAASNFSGAENLEAGSESGEGAEGTEQSQAAQEPDWKSAYQELKEAQEVRFAQYEARQAQYEQFLRDQVGSVRNPPQHVREQQLYGQQYSQPSNRQDFNNPQGWEDPYTQLVNNKTRQLAQHVDQRVQGLEAGIASSVRTNQRLALKTVLSEIPDFHDHIAPAKLNQAFETLIAQRAYNIDWEQALKDEYYKTAGPTLAKKQRESTNEVAAKRQEKQQQNLRAAQSVSPGGARFQQEQAPALKRGQKGTKDARSAFIHALAQHGVGG